MSRAVRVKESRDGDGEEEEEEEEEETLLIRDVTTYSPFYQAFTAHKGPKRLRENMR